MRKSEASPFLEHHGEGPAPLTYMQRTILHIANLVPDPFRPDPFRRISRAFSLTGSWNIEWVRQSLQAVIHRHASLRTRFVLVDGQPLQQVDQPREFFLPTVEVSGASAAGIHAEAHRLVQEFTEQGIELSIGPLFNARIFILADDHYLLVFCIDHIITDARSMAVLSQEFLTLYAGYVHGSPPVLAPVALSMIDIARSQRRTQDAWMKEHARYWKQRFADAPHPRFPSDPSPANEDAGVTEGEIHFGPELTTRLRHLSRTLRTSLSTTVFAIYVALLSRWCNQLDLVVCLVSGGRHRIEYQNIHGLFAYPLFLRVQLNPDDSFVRLVERVSNEIMAAYKHDDRGQLPLLMPELQHAGSFNWQTFEAPKLRTSESGPVVAQAAERASGASPPQLKPVECLVRYPAREALNGMNRKLPAALAWRQMLFLHDRPDEISGYIRSPAMSLAPASVERFVRNFLSLAEQFCDAPLCRVSAARCT